ncbi:MAG: hypothetical protein GY750_16375 [Lentisphaerae bacterium]|nr:hypothetical protein [Lentisphaerota bacterium]MCP4102973.1 hypothetical protein [Lentisphaerota bacterium]
MPLLEKPAEELYSKIKLNNGQTIFLLGHHHSMDDAMGNAISYKLIKKLCSDFRFKNKIVLFAEDAGYYMEHDYKQHQKSLCSSHAVVNNWARTHKTTIPSDIRAKINSYSQQSDYFLYTKKNKNILSRKYTKEKYKRLLIDQCRNHNIPYIPLETDYTEAMFRDLNSLQKLDAGNQLDSFIKDTGLQSKLKFFMKYLKRFLEQRSGTEAEKLFLRLSLFNVAAAINLCKYLSIYSDKKVFILPVGLNHLLSLKYGLTYFPCIIPSMQWMLQKYLQKKYHNQYNINSYILFQSDQYRLYPQSNKILEEFQILYRKCKKRDFLYATNHSLGSDEAWEFPKTNDLLGLDYLMELDWWDKL